MHIKARVLTNAKKDEVTELAPDVLVVSVRVKPERNEANRRVIELIAAHLAISAKQIRIISGHHSPAKILEVIDST
ncbi:MAG: DUF167 domain-containing protein [Candidatus Paceibacterota bacterium]